VKPRDLGAYVCRYSEEPPQRDRILDYVFAFDCHERVVRKIFEASGEDVQLLTDDCEGVYLTVKVWTPDKPDGPLYVNVRFQYRWSPEAQRFVRVTSNAQCPWVP